jgi:hypothetical protein
MTSWALCKEDRDHEPRPLGVLEKLLFTMAVLPPSFPRARALAHDDASYRCRDGRRSHVSHALHLISPVPDPPPHSPVRHPGPRQVCGLLGKLRTTHLRLCFDESRDAQTSTTSSPSPRGDVAASRALAKMSHTHCPSGLLYHISALDLPLANGTHDASARAWRRGRVSRTKSYLTRQAPSNTP